MFVYATIAQKKIKKIKKLDKKVAFSLHPPKAPTYTGPGQVGKPTVSIFAHNGNSGTQRVLPSQIFVFT